MSAAAVPAMLAGTNTDNELRPHTLDEVIGQKDVVESLRVALDGAAARGELPGHILFMGPAGTGKTTLALIVANMVGAPAMVSLIGPNVKSPTRDLLRPLITAKPRTVFFIDEIHRMYRPCQEYLFPIMEDGVIPDGTTVKLAPLLFIGATTDPARLLTPMLDRFVLPLMLTHYTTAELAAIATRAAGKLGCAIDADAAALIGQSAEGTPRVAIRMVRAARDYAYEQLPHGVVFTNARSLVKPTRGKVTIGLAAITAALDSKAYVWRTEGRSASDR